MVNKVIYNKTGFLIIAHGSKKHEWVRRIDYLIDELSQAIQSENKNRLIIAIEVAYLEHVPMRSITDGINELLNEKVEHIVAIPLFISSGSSHMNDIYYCLREAACPCPIEIMQPMNDHPLVISMILDRIQQLSQNEQQESVLIVGHGSAGERQIYMWNIMLQSIVYQLRQRTAFKHIDYATLMPQTLTQQIIRFCRDSHVLIIPAFISEGYFTQKVIPNLLIEEHLWSHISYNGKTYVPHPNVFRWLDYQIQNYIERREKIGVSS